MILLVNVIKKKPFLTLFDIFDIFLTDRQTDRQTDIQNLDVEAPARSLKINKIKDFNVTQSCSFMPNS